MADNTFLQKQVTTLETQINAIDAAILALITGNVQSYSLDTGQSKQTVTNIDLPRLNTMKNELMNQYTSLCARLNGAGGVIIPKW